LGNRDRHRRRRPVDGELRAQVLKAWREGTESISQRMYMVTVSAFTLWTLYGFVIGSWPVVVFNALSLVLSGTILALKLRGRREGNA